jgi:2-keto-3-deoxy-galactonokinase
MKHLLTLIALTGTLSMAMAQTAAPAAAPAKAPAAAPAADKKPTEQQNRMKTCNADPKAKALKGDERKKFMKGCLSGDEAAAGNSQQGKMKTCNAEAGKKALKGDERKAFMSTCLKG